MKKRAYDANIRKTDAKVSNKRSKIGVDPTVQYNGACEPYEDPADYLRFPIKAVRLA